MTILELILCVALVSGVLLLGRTEPIEGEYLLVWASVRRVSIRRRRREPEF